MRPIWQRSTLIIATLALAILGCSRDPLRPMESVAPGSDAQRVVDMGVDDHQVVLRVGDDGADVLIGVVLLPSSNKKLAR